MYFIMWTKRQVFRIICLGALMTLMGDVIFTGRIFSPSVAYAERAVVWILDSNGVKIGTRSYETLTTGWKAHTYHYNSDGTADLLWSSADRAVVWRLNSNGEKIGSTSYATVSSGWEARSYHRYSDGTATLLWASADRSVVWYLNSSGVKTATQSYATVSSGWEATSFVRYSDGTATLLWASADRSVVWYLNSSGVKTLTRSYATVSSGWTANSYVRNSDGTATLLWTSPDRSVVWKLNSNGAKIGSTSYATVSSGWTATSYMSSSAIGAMRIATTKSIERTKNDLAVITVQKTGSGVGTITAGTQVCDAACTELEITYIVGKQVDVTVTPSTGSYFAGWETAGGVQIENIYYAEPGDTVFAIFEQK